MEDQPNPKALAEKYHNPVLKAASHVTQIWGDGEITSTKGGDLFGQRSLHQMAAPIPGATDFLFAEEFPVKENRPLGINVSYAIVTDEQAYEIRAAIIDRVCEHLQSMKKRRY